MTKQQILKTYLSYHVKGLVSYYYGVGWEYICDAAQVWGGPRATEHTKECLLPRRPGC